MCLSVCQRTKRLSTDNPNRFYVYEHWRPDTGVIFYVGKGQKRRAWDCHRGRNRWHKIVFAHLRKMGLTHEVRIVQNNLTEREAFDKEIALIAHWRSLGAVLVNQTLGGDGPSGRKHTEEWKRAVSEKLKGRKISPESRAKMSAAAMGNKKGLGKKKPQHAIDAIIKFHKGRKRTPEQRERMSTVQRLNPGFKGRHHSEETIARISAAQIGKKVSDETRRKMSLHVKSAEHRRKLREFNRGKTHSDTTRQKISLISKAEWVRRRALKVAEIETMQLSLFEQGNK
jgi:hypothetical protein